MRGKTTREEIIKAADDLFYQRGYEHTSFADIAQVVGISRGNFYHHFKTKDEILAAVIQKRMADRRELLARWEANGDSPKTRVRHFIDILTANGDKIMRHGCPMGTLCDELAKLNHVAHGEAGELLALFRDWLARQFKALGRDADADELAMHLLMRSQGVATMATAFRDPDFVAREVRLMYDWLDERCPAG